VNVSSGKCVDVPGWSTASGVQLQQYTCVAGQSNQQWRLVASGTNTFQIVNVNSGLCVSDKDGSTAGTAHYPRLNGPVGLRRGSTEFGRHVTAAEGSSARRPGSPHLG